MTDETTNAEPTNDSKADETLAHFGVKGMQWGKRKASSESSGDGTQRSGLTDGQKKALKYAAGGALIAGALITTAILAKNGKVPVGNLGSNFKLGNKLTDESLSRIADSQSRFDQAKNVAQTAARGKKVVDDLRGNEAFQKKVSDFQSMIDDAHREQNRYMIDNSADSGIPYNSRRDNPYSPEARR